MPRRSTPFQAIVRLMRQQLAEPGVTVTESKLLVDARLGVDREVDIVIEGRLDGEPIVISMEVVEHTRPATLPWVQEMMLKHRDLPTNLLLLVSKSGFTRTAKDAVNKEPNVEALTPEVVVANGETVVKSFYMDTITYSATGSKVLVRLEDGQIGELTGQPDTDIYTKDGAFLGPLVVLVREALHTGAMPKQLGIIARNHPEREHATSFSLGLSIPRLGYYIRRADAGVLYLIDGLEIWGQFAWAQTEVPLTLASLGGRVYGAAEATIASRPTVWVGTTNPDTQLTTISWQTMDGAGSPQPQPNLQPVHFPGLLQLEFPDAGGPGPGQAG